tara:strand:- start:249 stop:662 length:414 start_codon:yes stop_codon:yes gene_type:complete
MEILMADAIDVAKLTKIYLKIRDTREEKAKAFNEVDSKLAEEADKIKSILLDHLQTTGTDSIKTKFGTFYRQVKTKYWTSDWDSIYAFIKEHGVPDILEKRLHQGNLKTLIEEQPELLPKGLNADSQYTISIRKPRK